MRTNFNRNRNIIIFAICLLFICAENVTSQIAIPKPSIYLAFDTDNPGYESVSTHDGLVTGNYQQVADRFGNSQRAIKFTNKGAGVRCSGFKINAVHTVSFWINITDPSEIPAGPTPFASTDTKYEIYNWTDINNFVLRGLGRRKATVGFNRFIPKPDGSKVPWYLWSYKPAEFNEAGWYHIFVVHGLYYTRLVMYKPSSEKAYSYIWLGGQDFSAHKYLYVGAFGENMPVNSAIDDFKLYNAEFTDNQIAYQHTAEYPKDTYVRIQNKNSGKYAVVEGAESRDLSLIIQHATGVGNDEWILSFNTLNECTIKNLHSGKFMVVRDASTGVGAEIVQYGEIGSDNAIWILEYSTLDTKYFRLKNKNSGKYLGVFQDSKLNDYKLIQVNSAEASVYWTFLNSFPNATAEIEPGLYRIKNKKSGLYLTLLNRSSEMATSLVQHNKYSSRDDDVSFDTWFINLAAKNRNGYSVMNAISKCYMLSWDNSLEGDEIFQHSRGSDEGDDWQFLPTGTQGEYRIRNTHNYYYAVVRGASTEENAHIILNRSGAEDNEIWTFERVFYSDSPFTGGTYNIRNVNSFRLMVVKNASKADDGKIIQFAMRGVENSEWEILPADYGFVRLRNKNSQKYLVVRNGNLDVGEILVQHGADSPNGYWSLRKEFYIDSGVRKVAYTLKNRLSGLYAVVEGAAIPSGAPIIQYDTGEENKLWIFEKLPSNALTRSFDSEREPIEADLNRPEVMVDCKNDIMLLDYPFEASTELTVRIMDLAGRQVYEGKKQVDSGNNVVTISQFNSALNANQFYVISIRSADGKVNCSAKAIMSK